MRGWIVDVLVIVTIGVVVSVVGAQSAYCVWCVPTFCGSTSECNRGCVCAIQMGDATGHCVGTR